MSKFGREEKLTKKTYDSMAEQFVLEHNSSGFWRKEMGIFKRFLSAGKILEIGSGGGRDARELVALGYEYIGTDISAKLVEAARRESLGITFLVKGINDLAFPRGTKFDGFWASAVILHIPKKRVGQALQQIRKYMRNGAIGYISLKEGTDEVLRDTDAKGFKDRRFFAYYSEEEFGEILRKNGFEILRMITHPMKGEPTWLCFFVKVLGDQSRKIPIKTS